MLFRILAFGGTLITAIMAAETKPNIIFVLTDDQDVHMQSLDYMPLLKKYIADQGTTYERHYCTTAICCPARVSIFTGKLSHNTNVTDVVAPYGGYPQFINQGLNSNYLPVWLQEAGYNTYYAGKLFNAHMTTNYDKPHAAGWTSSDFLLDPFTYSYWNATWQRNMDPPVSREGTYNTDDLSNKTIAYIREAHAAGKPFFIGTAPIAPHDEVVINPKAFTGSFSADDPTIRPQITPPKPAERHSQMFTDLKVPRTPNYNPDKPSGVNWVSRLPKLNQTSIDYNDAFFRARLQSLQSVDEMVEQIVKELEALGIVDNTYIIYTTDNGFHISQHRLQPGKTCGFETDIHIPLIIRGPGIPKAAVTDLVTSHTDLAPTILKMAGIQPRTDFDGVAIPLFESEMKSEIRAEHLGIEYWGVSVDASWHSRISLGNTYKGIRIQSKGYNLYYAVHCTNEHELYDMTVDPFQINNLLPSGSNGTGMAIPTYANSTSIIIGKSIVQVVARLDALIMVMKSCQGETCINPWSILHPGGGVMSLTNALNEKYDDFYMRSIEQNSVSFSMCANGYIVGAEGPQSPYIYEDTDWSVLT